MRPRFGAIEGFVCEWFEVLRTGSSFVCESSRAAPVGVSRMSRRADVRTDRGTVVSLPSALRAACDPTGPHAPFSLVEV